MKKALIALAATVLLPVAAAATFYTGNDLHAKCVSTKTWEMVTCTAYVTGVADAYEIGHFGIGGQRFCIPQQVTGGQVTDVVKQHLENYPAERHYTAASLVATALSKAFPCKK